MIIDCHTHIWSSTRQLGAGSEEFLLRQGGPNISAQPNDHALATRTVDKTLVLGLKSAALGMNVPNEFLADYVARHENAVGVAAIDPAAGNAVKEAEALLDRPEFQAIVVSPANQAFHPADSRAMGLYEMLAARRVPLLVDNAAHFHGRSCMEFARPSLWDEILRQFSDLTIVIASLGWPWLDECVALLGKHERAYSDIGGVVRRPWPAYQAMVTAHQFNVMDKILFSSDFPYCSPADAIETLYRLNEVAQGTNLPSIPREMLRAVVERDSLRLLGIARRGDKKEKVESAADAR